jgi:hypothetical protein
MRLRPLQVRSQLFGKMLIIIQGYCSPSIYQRLFCCRNFPC